MGHVSYGSVPVTHNMHPETVEAISIVLEELKINELSDVLWDSDDSWHCFFILLHLSHLG